MPATGCLAVAGRFARNLVLVDAAVFVATGVVCWLIGWRTAYAFSEGLFWAGVIVISIGALSAMGAAGLMSDARYRFSQAATPFKFGKRVEQDVLDLMDSQAFAILMGAAGVIAMLAGLVIKGAAR